jgi:hypothetical protein
VDGESGEDRVQATAKTLCRITPASRDTEETVTYDELYANEMQRAVEEYPPVLWEAMTPFDMLMALRREYDELHAVLWTDDVTGSHGSLIESIHVAVVAERIHEEMKRRKLREDAQMLHQDREWRDFSHDLPKRNNL